MEDLLISLDLRFIHDPVTLTTVIYNDAGKCIYKYYINKDKLHRVSDNVFFYGERACAELYRYRDEVGVARTTPVMSCRLSADNAEGIGVPVVGNASDVGGAAIKSPIRQRFEEDIKAFHERLPEVLIAVIQLPTGAKEIITNTTHIEEKIHYYLDKYDYQFRLKTCPEVKIVGIILV